MDEIFKDIPGFEGKYQASNIGNIKNIKTNFILKNHIDKSGRIIITLTGKRSKQKHYLQSRLMASAFLGLDLNNKKIQVCHKDDDTLNNNIDNFFLGTNKNNSDDRDNKLRQAYGEKNGMSKYCEHIIKNVISYLQLGYKISEIEKITGVHFTTIYDIRKKRRWNYLTKNIQFNY